MATLSDIYTFPLDTRAPQSITTLIVSVVGGSSIQCNWNTATDESFNHYELWYGTNQSDVQNRTGTAAEWGVAEDGALVNRLTTITTILGLTPGDDYYVSIFAVDDFEQTTRVDAAGTITTQITGQSSNFDLDTLAPRDTSTLTLTITSSTTVQCDFDIATDPNFDHYEIWYGTNQSDVQNRTGTAAVWDDNDDINLANIATTTTEITGLASGAALYFTVFSVDTYGNLATGVDAGPVTLFETTETAFDGQVAVRSGIIPTFDGEFWVKSSNPMVWFGEIWIYDDAAVLFDALLYTRYHSDFMFDSALYVASAETGMFSGQFVVGEDISASFDGATALYSANDALFDGQIFLASSIAARFNGQLIVHYVTYFNGYLSVGIGITDSFVATIRVVDSVEVLFNGSLEVQYIVGFYGRLVYRDPASPYFVSMTPEPGTMRLPADTEVAMTFADDQSGIDISTVQLYLSIRSQQEQLIFDGVQQNSYPLVTVTGTPNIYTFTFDGTIAGGYGFPYDSSLAIKVRMFDFGGNQFGDTYTIFIGRNPIVKPLTNDVMWDTDQDFKFNLEYGLNVPQRKGLEVRDDKLHLVEIEE